MNDARSKNPVGSFPSIRVQSVLYGLPLNNVTRSLEYLDNACRIARRAGINQISVAYGDCSPDPVISEDALNELRSSYEHLSKIDYQWFNSNLGSAAGHNRLLQEADADLVMILNPDVIVTPNLFRELLSSLGEKGVGLVEARQLPIEHPKDYDPVTGDTSWASTACAIAPLALFRELSGFDADTFFLYCDDVDFSWRVRLAGHRVVYCPSAVVFHDKRVADDGSWKTTGAEKYYSAEAGLLLPYKYSRPDLTEMYLRHFRESGDPELLRAAQAFELRRKAGRLPTPIDADHKVAQFIQRSYAVHRYEAR